MFMNVPIARRIDGGKKGGMEGVSRLGWIDSFTLYDVCMYCIIVYEICVLGCGLRGRSVNGGR